MPKTEPKERKTPERNPTRALYLEKARLEFQLTECADKIEAEKNRHNAKVIYLGNTQTEIKNRIAEIESELYPSPKGQPA